MPIKNIFNQGCQTYYFKKGQTFSKKRLKTANKIAEKAKL